MWQPLGNEEGALTAPLVSMPLGNDALTDKLLGTLGDIEQRDVPRSGVKGALAIVDFGFAGLQQQRRDLAALLHRRLDRANDGAADHHGRARGNRAKAGDIADGIAVQDADRLRRDAELLGGNATEHGQVALSLRRASDMDIEPSCRPGR